jgi:hypothetical protein
MMGLHVTRDPSVQMKLVGFHVPHDIGGFGGIHLCMFSRVWRGMGPCRHGCCKDRWDRLG